MNKIDKKFLNYLRALRSELNTPVCIVIVDNIIESLRYKDYKYVCLYIKEFLKNTSYIQDDYYYNDGNIDTFTLEIIKSTLENYYETYSKIQH